MFLAAANLDGQNFGLRSDPYTLFYPPLFLELLRNNFKITISTILRNNFKIL